ncbi:MAG: redoxin domain-containing protein [Chloroflexi bacterium]|nr:MAG: redoxin domain-containing protein [Chloroflexota bacterium]
MTEPLGKPFAGIDPVAENHPDSPLYNRPMSAVVEKMPGLGDLAPDFSLPGTPDGDKVTLASFRSKRHVVLVFYVFDFSPG